MTDGSKQWHWQDLDPTTRGVVALFSRHVGDELGKLPGVEFTEVITSSFSRVKSEDVAKSLGNVSFGGLMSGIVRDLSRFDPASINAMTTQLGELAGSTEVTKSVAQQIGDTLLHGDPYGAIEPLRILSEKAVEHLAPPDHA